MYPSRHLFQTSSALATGFVMITLFLVFLVSMVAPAIAVTLLTIADAFKAHHRFPLR